MKKALKTKNLVSALSLMLVVALAIVRLLTQIFIAWLPARISTDMQMTMRADLFDAFTRASWSMQANEPDGSVQELMSGQVEHAAYFPLIFASAFSAAAMFLVLALSSFLINPPVALAVLASAVVLFMALRPIDRLGRRAAKDRSEAVLDLAAGVNESVGLAEEAQVFGAGPAQRRHVGRMSKTAGHAYYRTQLTAGVAPGAYQTFVILLIAGGLTVLYLAGTRQVASLGAAVLLLVRASGYGQGFQANNHILIQTLPYVDRLQDAIAKYRSSTPSDEGQPLPAIQTMTLERVTYSYRAERPALHEVTISVVAGEAVGVIGPTGAGKSTLIQVLLRLRDPDLGTYLINGQPSRTYARADWQRRVAYVPQDPRVLRGTVADNIRFYRDFDDATIERAARLAHIHEEIMAMPAGYATVIGQRADAVSGGQRQRICLARALAGNPDVLVLDEPTSALDLPSESAVQASLADLHGKVTLFVVAHRVPLLRICDRVLVLDNGRVMAFAPALELARTDGFYRKVMSLAAPTS